MVSDDTVTQGSGNVFADLGFENPQEELLKAKLVGRTGKFSIDRLVRCLDGLDYEVDVVVRRKRATRSLEAV
jgi:hypothetical protein